MSAQRGYAALKLQREFRADDKTLFEAWTQAGVLSQWFGPTDHNVISANVDAVQGGKYKIVIQSPEGNEISHFGEFVIVDPHVQLVFTWVLADQACGGCEDQNVSTLVTLRFEQVENKRTRLTLLHEKLPDESAYEGHKLGWLSSLDSLERLISD
ncbi:activator of Hsp90 ATPase 1 family protein [Vibrio nigripulchritudo ATCC 27043]|uniref:SRPBCC family protein n=1 Tax=Vibrio nigripulchritudo TaxID=28173 RepID=UPI00021C1528|nr:SRPBCC domain-containing protein [Vibrio nigripulchritudo]EGU55710.1 activator of Hsp90 ATPase 1 family protein [Vibrio nigripulchritudo ATCC 27043]